MSKLFIGTLTAVVAALIVVGINAKPTTETVTAPTKAPISSAVIQAETTADSVENALTAGVPTQLVTKRGQTVTLNAQVDEYSASQVTSSLLEASKTHKTLYIFINSPGGSVLHGAQILSAMKALYPTHHIVTVCTGICASMAAIIFEYGEERVMASEGILMFHQASGGVRGELPRMINLLKAITAYTDAMDSGIARRVGISLDTYKQSIANELWLTSGQAVRSKYADRVALFPTVVEAKSSLTAKVKDRISASESSKPAPKTKDNVRHTEFFIENQRSEDVR
jgi:ATP-dependent Clp protease protease subunit